MKKISLKFKIIFATSIIILTVGGITSFLVFSKSSSILVNLKKDSIIKQNIEQTHETNLLFEESRLFTDMIASRTRVAEFLTELTEVRRQELVGIFDEYQKQYPQYLAIYLLDENGKTLISTDRRFLGANYNFRQYFNEAKKGNSHTEFLMGVTSKEVGYYFSSPVRSKDSKIIGVVVAKLQKDIIDNSLKESEVAKENNLMLADVNGIILYSIKPNRFLSSLGKLSNNEKETIIKENRFPNINNIIPLEYDEVKQALANYTSPRTIEFYDKTDKENEIVTINKIGRNSYYLISEIDTSDLIGFASSLTLFIGGGIFFAAVLALIIISLIINNFLKPLGKFKIFSQQISKGEFAQKIEINSKDEFEELAYILNNMSDRLKDLYDNLEKKVTEQTVNIQEKIKELELTKRATLNLLEDINEEKKISESRTNDLQKFQLAVENASDHIVITDKEGIVLYANKAVEIITGFSKAEVLGTKAGVKWGKLMTTDFYQKLWQTIKEQKITFSGEIKNKRKNGEIYIAQAQIAPILSKNGDVIFFIGLEHDITKAKEVDRMKTEFISLASHQLRTPLSAMRWLSEMLLEGDVGELTKEQKGLVNHLYESNQRMIGLVNALLNVSRIESGRIIIDPHPTDINKMIKDILVELQKKISEKNIQIISSINPNLPLINLDTQLIHEVYLNLLTNAIKYTPKGGEITIMISKTDTELISQVSDTGYGIPEKDKDKLFSKFYRGENVVKIETDGNGLGLYLVKAIIDSSKGKIWFKSEENKGTTFWFSLPLTGMQAKIGEVTLNS